MATAQSAVSLKTPCGATLFGAMRRFTLRGVFPDGSRAAWANVCRFSARPCQAPDSGCLTSHSPASPKEHAAAPAALPRLVPVRHGQHRCVEAAVAVDRLTKRFRRSRVPWRRGSIAAVSDITLEIPTGSIFGLVGPNGAGKTTLMRLILGLLYPTEGTVHLLGQSHSALGTPALREVGALIEEPRFYPYLSGRANLRQVATLLGSGAHRSIDAALDDVGLAGRGADKVRTYSLGMRQRLGIARCMLGRPRLLVLDEPTNGMDPQGIADTRDLLVRYAREHEATIFLSSHLLEGVEQLCDSVAFMRDGRIVRAGTIESFASPGSTWQLRVSNPGHAEGVVAAAAQEGRLKVLSSQLVDGALAVTLEHPDESAALNRTLVDADVDVFELVPVARSLAQLYSETIGSEYSVEWSE